MKEWFCEKCHYVWMSKYNKCCNPYCKSEGVEFDPCIHGKLLVGSSNSWLIISKRWEGNKSLENVADELINEGCYGAATIMNEWIYRLLKQLEEKE